MKTGSKLPSTNGNYTARYQNKTSAELIRQHKYFTNRIDLLWSRKQRVEAVLYMSILVEHQVREAILNFERMVEGAAFALHIGFNPRGVYNRKDIESQPLGYLIRILDTYTKDKRLISKLRRFSKTRNDCIHNLMNCKIVEVNKQLKNFNRFFYELMIDLLHLNVKQLDFVGNSFFRVCDECFKEILPAQVKF